MSKKTEQLKIMQKLFPNVKFVDNNGKNVTKDVKKSQNVADFVMRDRFKFRVWDKRLNRYLGNNDPTPMLLENGNLAYLDDEGMKFYEVEFCTGLKDKNDRFIYEGDIIEDKYGEKYIVKFGKHTVTIPVGYENGETECYGWYLVGNYWSCHLNPDEVYLIIGNTHENPELLEEYKKNTQS